MTLTKEMKCINCKEQVEIIFTQANFDNHMMNVQCPECEAVGFFDTPELNKFEAHVLENGSLPSLACPGSYPIYYVGYGNSVMCADCATNAPYEIEAHDIHWEGSPMNCDGCGHVIESAYGEVDECTED